MRRYSVPLLLLGGGGYTIRNVARCWTYETAVALNCEIANGENENVHVHLYIANPPPPPPPTSYPSPSQTHTHSIISLLTPHTHTSELPYNDYFEYFGPDFKLHISPTNMTNQNTLDYLNKIKARLFENLRLIPHAPSVQMQREFKCYSLYGVEKSRKIHSTFLALFLQLFLRMVSQSKNHQRTTQMKELAVSIL